MVGTRLVRCSRCAAATTFPPPDEAELQRAYAGSYRPQSGRFAAGGDRLLAWSRATLARRLDRRCPPGPVLDIGCGDGALLAALASRGREAVGLERGSVAERSHCDVRAVDVEDFAERPGQWAAAVFWHSLEHLRAPRVALRRAGELLAPAGMAVIAVPNYGSWQARLLGDRWLALDLPRHLVHLPAAALLAALREEGLQIERVSYFRGGQVMFGWLHGLVGLLSGHRNLYDAIRRRDARSEAMTVSEQAAAITTATMVAPAAAALALAEIAARAGGTVYVEARKLGRSLA